MRAVIQRAASGEVRVDGAVVGRLALDPHEAGERRQGLVVLLGVQRGDGPEQVATVARKIAELRILDDERSALDAGAPVLVISQFTLYGDTRKGRRPSWARSFPPISHVIPGATFHALKNGRRNSNVCAARRKLTEGNYVRLRGGVTRESTGGACPGLVPAPRAKARARRGSFP